jgi:hypothetical protein
MKNILVALSFVFIALNSFSQDVLVKQDGSKLEVKVLEITPENIKYKKWSNQEGPDYVINRSAVLVILYKNGETEVINASTNVNDLNSKKPEEIIKLYGQNMININAFHLLLNCATFSYERFNKRNTVSFEIPIMIGFDGSSNFLDDYFGYRRGTILTGLETKFYLSKNTKAKYFLGPTLHGGFYNSNGVFYGLFSNGLSLQVTREINLSFDAGIGLGLMSFNYIFIPFQLGITIGFRPFHLK